MSGSPISTPERHQQLPGLHVNPVFEVRDLDLFGGQEVFAFEFWKSGYLRGIAEQLDRVLPHSADRADWHLPLGPICADDDVTDFKGKRIGDDMCDLADLAVSATNFGFDLWLHACHVGRIRRSLIS